MLLGAIFLKRRVFSYSLTVVLIHENVLHNLIEKSFLISNFLVFFIRKVLNFNIPHLKSLKFHQKFQIYTINILKLSNIKRLTFNLFLNNSITPFFIFIIIIILFLAFLHHESFSLVGILIAMRRLVDVADFFKFEFKQKGELSIFTVPFKGVSSIFFFFRTVFMFEFSLRINA